MNDKQDSFLVTVGGAKENLVEIALAVNRDYNAESGEVELVSIGLVIDKMSAYVGDPLIVGPANRKEGVPAVISELSVGMTTIEVSLHEKEAGLCIKVETTDSRIAGLRVSVWRIVEGGLVFDCVCPDFPDIYISLFCAVSDDFGTFRFRDNQ